MARIYSKSAVGISPSRKHAGVVHGDDGDGSVEEAFLLWVARAGKLGAGKKVFAQARLLLPPPRNSICADQRDYSTAATVEGARVIALGALDCSKCPAPLAHVEL